MSGAGGESRTEMKYEILWNLRIRMKGEDEIYTNKIEEPKTGLLVPHRAGRVK